MLLDDALRGALRNFSTVFLVIFAVLGPLHLLYGFVFHDVLALRELHPAITEFPPSRQVRGVGRDALARADLWFWVLTGIELLLVPVFARLAAHVLEADARGEVPTAVAAWRRVRSKAAHPPRSEGRAWATLLAGLLVGLAVGFFTEATLMLVADLVPDGAAFAVIALARSVGHSAGASFVVVAIVFAAGVRRAAPEKVPELY